MTAVPERQLGVAPTYTLRALAHLLSYPGAELRALVPELKKVLADDGVLSKQRMLGLNKLLDSLRRGGGLRRDVRPWSRNIPALV